MLRGYPSRPSPTGTHGKTGSPSPDRGSSERLALTSELDSRPIDLMTAFRHGGSLEAAVELLQSWWGLTVPENVRDDSALLTWVRSGPVLATLPWPQNELLAQGHTGAEAPIARENESLWKAYLVGNEHPAVTFVVDDGERPLESTMPVGEFLLR